MESPNKSRELAKWLTPEAQALLRVHTAINLKSGIYQSFIKSADNTYLHPPNEMQTALSELARWELPIRVLVAKNWFIEAEGDAYFLEKYNPNTGEGVETSHGDGLIWVGYLDKNGKVLDEVGLDEKTRSDCFSDEQIDLIFQQGQELEAAGLI